MSAGQIVAGLEPGLQQRRSGDTRQQGLEAGAHARACARQRSPGTSSAGPSYSALNRQRHLLTAWESRRRRQTRTSRRRPGHREEGEEDRDRRGSRENIVRGRKEAVRGENTGRERSSTQHTFLPGNTPGRTPPVARSQSQAPPRQRIHAPAAAGCFTRRD